MRSLCVHSSSNPFQCLYSPSTLSQLSEVQGSLIPCWCVLCVHLWVWISSSQGVKTLTLTLVPVSCGLYEMVTVFTSYPLISPCRSHPDLHHCLGYSTDCTNCRWCGLHSSDTRCYNTPSESTAPWWHCIQDSTGGILFTVFPRCVLAVVSRSVSLLGRGLSSPGCEGMDQTW